MEKNEKIAGINNKNSYNINDLLEIMTLLRSDCPWDREQTHTSIRNNFIEEVYEAVEGIDTRNTELLKEELGDVLLQVVFHARMEQEAGHFSFDDVADGICNKLIMRHPHIFGEVKAETTDKVLSNWDKIKRSSKGQSTTSEAIDSVSKALPALMRAEKIQSKAAKTGFDFPDGISALQKIREETDELEQGISNNDTANIEEEIGDLLFSVCNVSRLCKVNAEEALYKANEKFACRFARLEDYFTSIGAKMEDFSLEELDKQWEKVKK